MCGIAYSRSHRSLLSAVFNVSPSHHKERHVREESVDARYICENARQIRNIEFIQSSTSVPLVPRRDRKTGRMNVYRIRGNNRESASRAGSPGCRVPYQPDDAALFTRLFSMFIGSRAWHVIALGNNREVTTNQPPAFPEVDTCAKRADVSGISSVPYRNIRAC